MGGVGTKFRPGDLNLSRPSTFYQLNYQKLHRYTKILKNKIFLQITNFVNKI